MKFAYFLTFILMNTALADSRSLAVKLHNRLTGVPPTPQVKQQMSSLIAQGRAREAAEIAMDSPFFYNLKAKNWIKTWTNESRSNRVIFNDYVATVLGMIRDDVPFNQVLTSDILYVGRDGLANVDAYNRENNEHYKDLEERSYDLKDVLVRRNQSEFNQISDTAGIITTRASGEAFFSAGTNRRMTRFLFINFLCRDFEALHDITIPDIYVRRDVERNPGGDSRTFKNQCVGCHAGQDALGGAWAYYDYDGRKVVYSPGNVRSKINKNVFYPEGHVVADDAWVNLWTTGQNSSLGWGTTTSGNGAKSFGQMIVESEAFGECMAQRAFELTCTRSPLSEEEKARVKDLGTEFMTSMSYNMKELIAQTAVGCVVEE